MNYLVGVILCIYNMWFILTVDYPVLEGWTRDEEGNFLPGDENGDGD